jgi:hypothetical protein
MRKQAGNGSMTGLLSRNLREISASIAKERIQTGAAQLYFDYIIKHLLDDLVGETSALKFYETVLEIE